MNTIIGHLKKLNGVLKDTIEYTMTVGHHAYILNNLLGKRLTLKHTGNIHCIQCGRKTKKSFQQGFCFPCLRRLQECNLCVMHPERCQVEQGTCPKDDWAHQQCYQRQYVYLANSSGLKVGITREGHIPTRWIDQGAIQAIAIYYVSNRYQVGVIEVALKAYTSDRTNWQRMLKNEVEYIDLIKTRDTLFQKTDRIIQKVIAPFPVADIKKLDAETPITLQYPVLEYPKKIKSLTLDQPDPIEGVLLGIKGQYLMLDQGVINIRKFSGYEVMFNLS